MCDTTVASDMRHVTHPWIIVNHMSHICETNVTHMSALQRRFEETFFMFIHVHACPFLIIPLCSRHPLNCEILLPHSLWLLPLQLGKQRHNIACNMLHYVILSCVVWQRTLSCYQLLLSFYIFGWVNFSKSLEQTLHWGRWRVPGYGGNRQWPELSKRLAAQRRWETEGWIAKRWCKTSLGNMGPYAKNDHDIVEMKHARLILKRHSSNWPTHDQGRQDDSTLTVLALREHDSKML